jgi:hypothetical protein
VAVAVAVRIAARPLLAQQIGDAVREDLLLLLPLLLLLNGFVAVAVTVAVEARFVAVARYRVVKLRRGGVSRLNSVAYQARKWNKCSYFRTRFVSGSNMWQP